MVVDALPRKLHPPSPTISLAVRRSRDDHVCTVRILRDSWLKWESTASRRSNHSKPLMSFERVKYTLSDKKWWSWTTNKQKRIRKQNKQSKIRVKVRVRVKERAKKRVGFGLRRGK